MSWAGKIVAVADSVITVERLPHRPYERFECDNPNPRGLGWMIGMTIEASCAGCSVYMDEIDIGTRTGHTSFRLRTRDEAGKGNG